MDTADRRPSSGGRRTRGSKAGLNLTRIIEAARSIGARALTMQAVADRLGVDRKAVNHYVSDRESLLRLVALDAFAENSSAVDIPADASWQEACRIYAAAFTSSMIAADAFAEHLMPDGSLYAQFVEPAEVIAKKLTEAGFDDEATVRSLALLTNICWAYARDALFVAHGGERIRPRLTREVVEGRGPQVLENLARIVECGVDTYDRQQLDLSVQVFIHGIDAVLLGNRSAAEPTPDR
ncbi:TetR/AcrR family transcriptional regulator [Streptomyces sp. NPDC057199]|uniref:TetR/AcrR family transcriptional regulator n=1 Tax=Streptomyces sp. NPDC057199 TaxID=3346047 RepID=UPI00362BAF9C